jgi:hypothetical protein
MPRLSFKPDSSFFRKIVIGAVGAQAVRQNLESHGHTMAELENGSTDTKIWKDVKRKRVRIPDLVCIQCGLRVESRAKTQRSISMSHSSTDAERAWDFGMVDTDLVAFPICESITETNWSSEKLQDKQSYWRSRQRVKWRVYDFINYIRVEDLRAVSHSGSSTKGVVEGSETSIEWDAILSTREGIVEYIRDGKIGVRRFSDDHLYPWQNKNDLPVVVEEGDTVHDRQILASSVPPLTHAELECPGYLPINYISDLITSPERTQRFTGIKIARLRNDPQLYDLVQQAVSHPHEDLYVQLEGAIYLSRVCKESARELLGPYLTNPDEQVRLETIVALAEIATVEAVDMLTDILAANDKPYFLRSATAWALGKIGTDKAIKRLMQAFSDVDQSIREEALEAIDSLETHKLSYLLTGLTDTNLSIAAGSAEAIRRHAELPDSAIREIVEKVEADAQSIWAVWLLGQLPQGRECVRTAIASLQDSRPEAHYAITVLWSFVESWIARHWELHPSAISSVDE